MEKEGIAYFKILQNVFDSHNSEEEEEPLLKKYKKYGMIALGMDTTFILEKYKEMEDYA